MWWLNMFHYIVEKSNVKSENIYNMDELGFAISSTKDACVIINARMRIQFQVQPG
jgi:hypothetical protein